MEGTEQDNKNDTVPKQGSEVKMWGKAQIWKQFNLAIRQKQFKTTLRFHLPQKEWLSFRNQIITKVGDVVTRKVSFSTVSRSVDGYNQNGNQCGEPLQN